ncbi:MAG: hypothetical protein HY905_16905 [Deltaproteobacteria bacterium]|nr:hypothetical protein [Deltaproteobacteria bacterium]
MGDEGLGRENDRGAGSRAGSRVVVLADGEELLFTDDVEEVPHGGTRMSSTVASLTVASTRKRGLVTMAVTPGRPASDTHSTLPLSKGYSSPMQRSRSARFISSRTIAPFWRRHGSEAADSGAMKMPGCRSKPPPGLGTRPPIVWKGDQDELPTVVRGAAARGSSPGRTDSSWFHAKPANWASVVFPVPGADGGHAPRPPIGKIGHGQPSFRRVPIVRARVEVERVGFGHAQAAANALEHLDVVLDRRAHLRLLVEPLEEPPEIDTRAAVVPAGVLQAEPPFSTPTSLHQQPEQG